MVGYFLRALYEFRKSPKGVDCRMIHTIQRILHEHRTVIADSTFGGLPELTNQDGAFCAGSCATQAWSSATLLDLLHELKDDIVYC